MSITLASKPEQLPGGAFAGKVFFMQNVDNGASVYASGYDADLLATSSSTAEQCFFQLLGLPSGEIQLFSNYANTFVSGFNSGSQKHPGDQILRTIVQDERWSRFWLAWDTTDASFTLQSSFNKFFVSVVNDGTLKLVRPEPPKKPADRSYFFRPITVAGVHIKDPRLFLP